MSNLRHVAFCGGGSGGHLFPAIAVAEELLERDKEFTFTFLTSSRAIDAQILQGAHLPDPAVHIVAQPLATSGNRLALLWAVWRSLLICRRQLQRSRPNVVVGTGGFASIPGALAAWWLKIPVVLLECNAIPGRANRWLSRFAFSTASGWPINADYLQSWNCKVRSTGVPVRKNFYAIRKSDDGPLHVLILGGSQGATRLNDIVLNALAQLNIGCELKVVHQTGESQLLSVQDRYQSITVASEVAAFIEDIANSIAVADVVISRAGAVTLAEIAAVGRPAILFPLSTAADDHQTANAMCLSDAGAAISIDEQGLNAAQQLHHQLSILLGSSKRRQEMSAACAELSTANAVVTFIDLLHECVRSRDRKF